jgi:hypothetical protein
MTMIFCTKKVQKIVVMASNGEWRACARGGIIPQRFRFRTPGQ